MNCTKYILLALALIVSAGARGQYNPTNPAEPGAPVTTYVLTLQADPSGGGSFNVNTTTSYVAGATVNLRAYNVSNFSFVAWEEDGSVISTAASFTYTMPAHDAKLIARYTYTPSNPTEPAEPVMPVKPVYSNLYLTALPTAGGSFNIGSGNSYEVGTTVNVRASAATNFTFEGWTQDGELISTSTSFNYVILEGQDANRLVANFRYTPGSPGEPSEPEARKIYHRVFLQSDPAGGGYFNVESGNQYEEGSTQTFRAYNNQWYTFQNWTLGDEVLSTSSTISYTIPAEDVALTAHYTYNYNPGNPGEPGSPTTKQLNVYGMTATGALGQTVAYLVFLENTEDVYGVTVVLHFPEDFIVKTDNILLAERAAGHDISVTALDDNAYRFDLTGDAPLTGANGKIFDVYVTISDMVQTNASYQVALTNAARLNTDGSKEVISARSGYIFVEDVKEDGLYAQFYYEKLHSRVKFSNLSSDRALSYTWDFGDGTTSTEENPLHVYAESGYYDVRLIAKGQTGTDVAVMTVLINDESTWRVDGMFFLDTEEQGVRYFTNLSDLLTFMASKPISGDLRLAVKAGMTFDCALTDDDKAHLTTIVGGLVSGGYTLFLSKNGDGNEPVLCFGNQGEVIDSDVVSLFMSLGQRMVCNNVQLRLWGIAFDPSKIASTAAQTLLSGQPTALIDFSAISADLTFSWSVGDKPDTASGFVEEGVGNIPSMTILSGSADVCDIIYNIYVSYKGTPFCDLTHTITLKPALEGEFTDLTPIDGAELETTTVTLTWNSITNAVYDVYLWNAANQRPATPVAEGITEEAYTSRNFCQNGRTYKWQVVARNAVQQIVSDERSFTINILPDLHVTAVRATADMEAGQTVTIEWTVRNDGAGATGAQSWTDRLWLMPDVYNGTATAKTKQLTAVANVKALEPGEEYTASAQVTLDEASYGSYYILAASDMSTVTLIDWTSVGGTIINPYEPPYLFATTAAGGNQLREHGEENNRSDNFFYVKVEIAMPQMIEDEWETLKDIYAEVFNNGESWTEKWNFDVELRTVLTLPGVSILGGHVVGIDLHANGLTGTFPSRLLTLPALRTLNLSNNALSGNLSEAVTTASSTLESLNVASNQLEGNIGAVAEKLPVLTSLIANDNRLSEVSPLIPSTVTTVALSRQTIDEVVTLELSGHGGETVMSQIPNILTYNHSAHQYNSSIDLQLQTDYDEWGVGLNCKDEAVTFTDVTTQNAYHGVSGDLLRATAVDGSTFPMALLFADGDTNFNGAVDVTDLQAQINFAFEAYNDRPFNFTAANLWEDDVINVQDVVRMVDMLLNTDMPVAGQAPMKSPRKVMIEGGMPTEAQAMVFVESNKIFIDTNTPIAAFELTLKGADVAEVSLELERLGFSSRTKNVGATTRLVVYSLSGATLPVGTTVVCEMANQNVEIISAVLSDADAGQVSISLSGNADGLGETKQISLADTGIFDMSGRKVVNSKLQRGVYIINGKKIVKM